MKKPTDNTFLTFSLTKMLCLLYLYQVSWDFFAITRQHDLNNSYKGKYSIRVTHLQFTSSIHYHQGDT